MPTPKLAIVIVNWNTRQLVLDCLQSIEQYPPQREYEVWLVDNASRDGSIEAVSTQFPKVKLIANQSNLGFAAANNQAIEQCDAEYVLALNSDTQVQANALESMCQYLDQHPQVGIVACRLINPDGSTQRSAWRGYPGLKSALIEGLYLWRLMPKLVAQNEISLNSNRQAQQVDHLLGACMLVRRDAIEQVGMFDTGYFLFFEETDWCYRIAAAGWHIIYLPQTDIIHFGQQSMQQIPDRTLPTFYASLCRFVRKQGGALLGLRLFLLKSIIFISVLIRLALWSVRLIKQRSLSLRMLGGYSRVIRQLPSL
jgi:GT2 family glycosyltransferase